MDFDSEKARHLAYRRDYQRSKLSQSKRWRADEEAEALVRQSEREQKRIDDELERKQMPEGRDEAMNTVIQDMHRNKSIKKFVV